MRIGILVNTDKSRDHVLGMVKAALSRGHEISIFVMDTGTKLLADPAFSGICGLRGVSMSFCELSWQKEGAGTEVPPADMICGSQYNNAVMVRESDRILVF